MAYRGRCNAHTFTTMSLFSSFYKRFIYSSETDLDIRSRAVVLNWLLIGALCLTGITFMSALSNIIVGSQDYSSDRVIIIGSIFVALLVLYKAGKRHRLRSYVATILVALFCAAGSVAAYIWGIFVPISLLIMSMSIVMAGVLINARASLYTAMYVIATLTLLEYLRSLNRIDPDFQWMAAKPTLGDVVGFAAIYSVIALISWLFNAQMEQSLHRAQKSEAALRRQKAILEIRVQERTQELEKLQLEKIQQFYRFAELGRLSTSLFHDLANHLTTINMDLEGLSKNDQSKIMLRLQQNANYIEDVIKRVRSQLLGREESEVFSPHKEIEEIIKILTPKAKQAGVTLQNHTENSAKSIVITGSLTRFRQLIINLLSNAVDAYELVQKHHKLVTISTSQNKHTIAITVHDEAIGIPPEKQDDVFRPFFSTKRNGVGIGLFIVKQITEQYFDGTLSLTSSENIGSTFTIKIPKNNDAPSSASRRQ